jgi:two-component system chemotaxis sensor kinase CheA
VAEDLQREAFREEAYELLAELECSLLELEDQPEDQGLVNRVFRAMHTIKGSGGHVRVSGYSRLHP